MQTDKKINMSNKRTNGFTLIELMVTLAVATILVTIAIPGFRSLIQNNRAATQSNELLSGLMLARSEAIKRGVRVSICSSSDEATCAASTNWATGWIVFTDDSGVAGSKDGTDVVIRAWDELNGTPTLTSAVVNNIQYLRTGLVAAADTFTYTAPGCTGDQRRTISISATGRARVATAPCP